MPAWPSPAIGSGTRPLVPICLRQIGPHKYEHCIFGESRREAPWHSPPRAGDHLSRGCRTRRPFLCRSGSADGIGALGAAAARSRCPYRTESLVPHRCRQRGRDHRRCAPRPGSATAPDSIGSRTGRCNILAGAIILPFQPTFAAILAIGVVPLIAYQYWRDVRMLHMPRLAGICRPNGPALD